MVFILIFMQAIAFQPRSVIRKSNIRLHRNFNRCNTAESGVNGEGIGPLSIEIQQDEIESSDSIASINPLTIGLPIMGILGYKIAPGPLDALTADVWHAMYNNPVVQNPLFEASVASGSFVAWIVMWSSMHLILGEDNTPKWRLDKRQPVEPFLWVKKENWFMWFNPLFSYMGSIYLYHLIHPHPPLEVVPPTFGHLSAEVVFGVILYDLLFYPIHFALHNAPAKWFRKQHVVHHRWSKSLNAVETVQHSYIDGFLQVVVNIIVQQISPFGGPKHPLSRIIHNIVVTYLLTESHSGYDLPWMTHYLLPNIFGGAPRHEKHHAGGGRYLQQYFMYLDDAFGTGEPSGVVVLGKGEGVLVASAVNSTALG